MFSELGNFFLALGLGFTSVQILASLWGIYRVDFRYLTLGQKAAYVQGGFLSGAFLTLLVAFYTCDFSLLGVSLHDHTQLPWYYRISASWGNHEGSLLLFVLILSGMGVAQAFFLKKPFFRARTLTAQGLLIALFLIFLILTSNPFTPLSFFVSEGHSLNPLLQDRGLLFHPPLLYFGYVGFSAPFSLAIAALWGAEKGGKWVSLARPWVLVSWSGLTAGITLGSWWAYYELGWGGWWFWDPVENASFMPWLAGTALLHTLRARQQLYRWSLFLSLLTFGFSLVGTFLVRSGLMTSVHSFAQDPERGLYILCLLSLILGSAFSLWIWKAPRIATPPLPLFSRPGILFFNSLLLSMGLAIICLGTFYPLASEYVWGKAVAIGAPYFERTFIPLLLPLLILLPIGCLFQKKEKAFWSFLMGPFTATLGMGTLLLYWLYPLSLLTFTGIVISTWILGGILVAYKHKRIPWGATLAHMGVGISLLGVSVGGGLRTNETSILSIGETLPIGGRDLTLQGIHRGQETTYFYEKAIFSYGNVLITPEKRLYQPQNSLLSKTAIHTNGLRDLYVILGPYQGNNRWLIRASFIPLAPLIWMGGALMVLGGLVSIFGRIFLTQPQFFWIRNLKKWGDRIYLYKSKGAHNELPIGHKFKRAGRLVFLIIPLILSLSFSALAENSIEKRATAFYQEVRCPVCLGQSIADSETPESQALKSFIFEKLKRGETEEAIRDTLRQKMGDDILLRPPFKGYTLFLWLAPFGLFFLIFFGIGRKIRRNWDSQN